MKCKYCNREIKDGAKFCSYCGKSQEAPQTTRTDTGKRTSKTPIIIISVLLLICAVGVGVFALRGLGGNHAKKKDGLFDFGGSQTKENSLTDYLEYIGTEFEELPDSFEREVTHEFEDYDYIEAKKDVEYAGIEGEVIFYGYDIKNDAPESELALPTEITSVNWVPKEQDAETKDELIEQMNKDYGEYDGKEIHTIKDRQSDPSGETEILKYTYYYWDAHEEWDYDVSLEMAESMNGSIENADIWRIGISPCIGEPDSEYLKPLHKIEKACEDKDTELMEEAFSDAFYESTDITNEEVVEMMEEMQDSTSEIKISFDVKNTERLSATWGFMTLFIEYGVTEKVQDVREKYIVDADLIMSTDGEEETGELTIIVGKDKGTWKILSWEIL